MNRKWFSSKKNINQIPLFLATLALVGSLGCIKKKKETPQIKHNVGEPTANPSKIQWIEDSLKQFEHSVLTSSTGEFEMPFVLIKDENPITARL
jgi:hypothetical protein